jgi:hypothetical protein
MIFKNLQGLACILACPYAWPRLHEVSYLCPMRTCAYEGNNPWHTVYNMMI